MRRVVGIDLGTTHTVVAWCARRRDGRRSVLPIPQLVARGRDRGARALPFPALRAARGRARRRNPWGERPWVSGELARAARRRGARAPRGVGEELALPPAASIARAPILPWARRRRRACPASRRSTRARSSWRTCASDLGRGAPGRAARRAGRRAHRARVVRRGRARAHGRGGARRGPLAGAARGAHGGVLRLPRRTTRSSRARRCASAARSRCSSATSAAARRISRSCSRALAARRFTPSVAPSAVTSCSAATTWISRSRTRWRAASSLHRQHLAPGAFAQLVVACRVGEGGAPRPEPSGGRRRSASPQAGARLVGGIRTATLSARRRRVASSSTASSRRSASRTRPRAGARPRRASGCRTSATRPSPATSSRFVERAPERRSTRCCSTAACSAARAIADRLARPPCPRAPRARSCDLPHADPDLAVARGAVATCAGAAPARHARSRPVACARTTWPSRRRGPARCASSRAARARKS